jgi:hypothetical protein
MQGGGKGSKFMKKKMVEYTEGEIERVKIVKDFLPSPSELVLKDDNVKVTLSFTRRSIEFFKREAKRQHVFWFVRECFLVINLQKSLYLTRKAWPAGV